MVTTTGVAAQDTIRTTVRTPPNVELPRADTRDIRKQVLQQANTAPEIPEPAPSEKKSAEQMSDSVRVSSTLGKAASSGLLTRDEAVAIYQKIANML